MQYSQCTASVDSYSAASVQSSDLFNQVIVGEGLFSLNLLDNSCIQSHDVEPSATPSAPGSRAGTHVVVFGDDFLNELVIGSPSSEGPIKYSIGVNPSTTTSLRN